MCVSNWQPFAEIYTKEYLSVSKRLVTPAVDNSNVHEIARFFAYSKIFVLRCAVLFFCRGTQHCAYWLVDCYSCILFMSFGWSFHCSVRTRKHHTTCYCEKCGASAKANSRCKKFATPPVRIAKSIHCFLLSASSISGGCHRASASATLAFAQKR